MKFASLGSGSDGNALLISSAGSRHLGVATTIMLDCGFSLRETERRLARLDVRAADLSGIVVTHEHQDHVSGVFKLARRHHIPVWLTFGTFQAVRDDSKDVDIHFCRDGDQFAIGDLQLIPYTVPHDAREPVQYLATDGHFKLGVLTDVGQSTAHLVDVLGACDALMLECNHDSQMLADSRYPASLKRRIAGDYGHLSNRASAAILAALNRGCLQKVIAAHLSTKNNTPSLARAALCSVLDLTQTEVVIACQDEGFGWVEIEG